jgi:ABC-2 type transport system ATP-binding protein
LRFGSPRLTDQTPSVSTALRLTHTACRPARPERESRERGVRIESQLAPCREVRDELVRPTGIREAHLDEPPHRRHRATTSSEDHVRRLTAVRLRLRRRENTASDHRGTFIGPSRPLSYARPVISVQDLVKRYKKADRNAVDGITFDVQAGEFFALLGPNGAGKTTTISILTTTLAPTSGTAKIDGRDIVRESSAVRRIVGIIFQRPSLDMNLTAEENVRFHAILYKLYPYAPSYALMPAEYRKQVKELADLLGIGADMGKPMKTFSGGMRRKLEIVRSLIHRPKVLFLDEPTAGLDVPSRRTLWEYLGTIRRESGTTIFLTTHYLEEAEEADHICIIDKGKIVTFGTPDDIKRDLVQEYVLVDADDRRRLRDELARLELPIEGAGPIKIMLGGRGVHQILKAIETPLTVVRTHAPTLEDAYLEIVSPPHE